MADAAVHFLLESLEKLAVYHVKLIKDADIQLHTLEEDLLLFRSFLVDSVSKGRKDQRMQAYVRQIRDVVYQAEDIIDAFVTLAAVSKSQGYFSRAFGISGKLNIIDLHSIAKKVESIGTQIKQIYGSYSRIEFATLNIAADGSGDPQESQVFKPAPLSHENVVGFDGEAATVIGYLTQPSQQQLDIISIVGMPGLGKTTLAGKIFHDATVEYEFPTRIWLDISQKFSSRDLFLSILERFPGTVDLGRKTENDLAKIAADCLRDEKFLIVMDDVWTRGDSDKLKAALPFDSKRGKVMITSRQEEVASYANTNRPPHKLDFLKPDDSWLLLRLEVFRKPEFPPELEVVGRLIAKNCKGLPLAIVVIGGILASKYSATPDMTAKKKAWEKVSSNVLGHLHEDQERRMVKIISLSYDRLPYHLRSCFLYLGMFPEDYEIPVWKLIRMWIGEVFIQQQKGSSSLEETAESYLEELISRNLVRVEKMKPDGKVKSCRIHDMLRDFCRNDAGNEENFLQEMKCNDGVFDPAIPTLQKCRRLSLHSGFLEFISSEPSIPFLRSLVCFSKEGIELQPKDSSAIPAAFKLLRVLDVKPLKHTKIAKEMYQLLHLRYLALSFNLSILPSNFSQLGNIQTLIVDTTSPTLEIKADIWNMNQLRYLKTNVSTTLPKPGKSSSESGKLQTLSIIAAQSCTGEIFAKARKLKKLGIRGQLSLLLHGKKDYSFDNLRILIDLEKLKLLNDNSSQSRLTALPEPYQFPSKLRSLTLSSTCLDWDQMNVLGMLAQLEVLKLKDRAFRGESWEAVDGGFRRLEVLHIVQSNLSVWMASKHHFPSLRRLLLKNCEELTEVPIGLADIPSFQVLDLYRTTTAAAASAKRIQEVKVNQTSGATAFKLSIFPPPN